MSKKPSNRFIMRKQASALLLALLMLVAVSSFTLFILKVTLVTNLSTNYEEDSESAYRIARAGLDEALVSIEKATNTSAGTNTTASLLVSNIPSRRRGFTNQDCSTLSTLGSTSIRKDCPYYDVVIRRTVPAVFGRPVMLTSRDVDFTGTAVSEIPVKLGAGSAEITVAVKTGLPFDGECPSGLNPDYSYTYRQNDGTTTNVLSGSICKVGLKETKPDGNTDTPETSVTIYSVVGSGNDYHISLLCSSPCANGTATLQLVFKGQASTVDPATLKSSFLKFDPYGVTSAQSSGTSTSAPQYLQIYNGYTTVESTGYSGRVKRKLVMYIRTRDMSTIPSGGKSREVYEFGREFDSYGCIKDAKKTPGSTIVGDTIVACPNFINTGTDTNPIYTEVLQ